MRFAAPEHTSSIMLASGPVNVIDGVATIDNPSDSDRQALAANGFTQLADEAVTAGESAAASDGTTARKAKPAA